MVAVVMAAPRVLALQYVGLRGATSSHILRPTSAQFGARLIEIHFNTQRRMADFHFERT